MQKSRLVDIGDHSEVLVDGGNALVERVAEPVKPIGLPAMRVLPLDGLCTPGMVSMNVDSPAPLSPNRQWHASDLMSNDTPDRAMTRPKCFWIKPGDRDAPLRDRTIVRVPVPGATDPRAAPAAGSGDGPRTGATPRSVAYAVPPVAAAPAQTRSIATAMP
jgi:hypothetical protein